MMSNSNSTFIFLDSKQQILLSVIVPVYNAERFLDECIDSLVKQTWENLEIILVDDGSSDKSGIICDEWQRRDSRIIVIHQENKGVSEARNAGLEACKGDVIGFVDADDWCELDMYRKMLERMLDHGADVVACGYFDYPYGLNRPVLCGTEELDDGDFYHTAIHFIERNGYFTSMNNKIYRREKVFTEIGMISVDPLLGYGEDEAWLFSVLRGCESISFVPLPFYHWRPNETSVTRTTVLTEKQISLLAAKEKAMKFLPDCKAVQKLAKANIYNNGFNLCTMAYCLRDREQYIRLLHGIRPYCFDWLISMDIKFVRKIKVLILKVLMQMRLPVSFIESLRKTNHLFQGKRRRMVKGNNEGIDN